MAEFSFSLGFIKTVKEKGWEKKGKGYFLCLIINRNVRITNLYIVYSYIMYENKQRQNKIKSGTFFIIILFWVFFLLIYLMFALCKYRRQSFFFFLGEWGYNIIFLRVWINSNPKLIKVGWWIFYYYIFDPHMWNWNYPKMDHEGEELLVQVCVCVCVWLFVSFDYYYFCVSISFFFFYLSNLLKQFALSFLVSHPIILISPVV